MAPKKSESKTEGAAPKAKAAPAHGTYQAMITDAIIARKDRYGSSRQALKKYVRANNNIVATDSMFDSLFNKALKVGVEKGVFEQPKGPSGGTKLAKKSTAPAAKKPAAKKAAPAPKEAKEPKEPKEKKAAPKKAAAKKETKEPKEKKAAPKKPAAKKETTKKAASTEEKPAALTKTKSGRVTKAAAKPAAAKKAAPKKAAAPKKEKATKKEAVSA